jgi:hypothetical protein
LPIAIGVTTVVYLARRPTPPPKDPEVRAAVKDPEEVLAVQVRERFDRMMSD